MVPRSTEEAPRSGFLFAFRRLEGKQEETWTWGILLETIRWSRKPKSKQRTPHSDFLQEQLELFHLALTRFADPNRHHDTG